MSNHIYCPLCKEKIMLKEYKGSFLWNCKHCPFVGFEYYHDNDAKRVREKLNQ